MCPVALYDRDVPSKQNVLCDRQAPLEVILTHPDLDKGKPTHNFTDRIRNPESFDIDMTSANEDDEDSTPRFNFVFPSPKRFA